MRKKLFTFLLAIVASVGILFAESSGTCGANLTWTLSDEGVLTISGTGAMTDYSSYSYSRDAPWYSNRSSIKSVVIEDGVTIIGSNAFNDCNGLTSIEIPNSVTSIGYNAFSGCSSLPVVDNLRYADTYLVEAVDKTLSSYTIKEGTKWIGSSAFIECGSLTSVTIPNSVTSIGNYAFRECSGLTSVAIGSSVTSIGSSAFEDCRGLTSVTIPSSVTNIGDDAFYGCVGLTKVNITDISAWCNITFDGYGSNPLFHAKRIYLNNTEIYNLVIPEGVKSIRVYAFENCSSLTSVTIPNSVTSIGDWAFSVCSSLTSVTIPNSVTSIGSSAFKDCNGLTSIEIPNSVTSIGESAFSGCSSLPVVDNLRYADTYLVEAVDKTLSSYTIKEGTRWIGSSAFRECGSLSSITIPNSVTSIGDRAFYYCSSLTSVTIPNRVTSIGQDAFFNCSSLTSVTIPNSVTSIGYQAFRECSSLTSVTIPNSVTSIGEWAFYKCSGLTSVAIGSSVTSIGGYAFYNCSSLSKIYSLPQTPPSISYNTFSGIATEAVVYVSSSALSAYKSASYWNDMNIVGMKAEAQTTESPTSVVITASQDLWKVLDEYIYQIGIEGGEQEAGNTLEYIGLEPNSEYKDVPVVLTSNTGETETVNVTFTTTALTLTTQQPKVVSSTTAILLAETNMSDAEVNCGFEWKRENAPDAMAGTKVYCPVANGTMAGRLKGLKDDVYYKYRAFYQSTAGNTYYGDWQYIFTGDDAVEFDPVMYTYAASAVTETEATLKGYALAGSDDFTEQGFEYWAESRVIPEGANHAPARAYQNAIGEHQSVQATGISMKVTLTNLDEGTVYKYRTYAVVNGAKVYGSEMSFTTRGEYLYTVTFVDYDGTILGSDKVHYGTSATAPEDPSRGGYNFIGWDKDYSNVTDDLTVTAQYTVSTALPQATTDSSVQKFIRDGQLLIQKSGKTYTIQGVEVK